MRIKGEESCAVRGQFGGNASLAEMVRSDGSLLKLSS